MKRILWILSGIIVALLIIIIIKTIAFKSMQLKAEAATLPVFGNRSASNLSKAITFPTISNAISAPVDTVAFKGYLKFISEAYPLADSMLKKETFSSFSLLYTWEGKNPALKPVILTAHMDVVPPVAAESWTKPPFSGENDGTFIWGRGTLDDKIGMISILEAVERLLSENYQPERTVYLAFGHDEEISGLRGAAFIASALKERKIDAEFVIDEGEAVTVGMIPMISSPVALVGTSEKGYLSVTLTVEKEGGHSSYPEKETAITILTMALNSVVTNQMDARISGPVNDFMRYLGPEMPFYAKAVFANKWLFKGIILNLYQGDRTSNAMVRTTTAPTILHAGIKDNIIPPKAEAVVNFRILPGETSADVMEHLKKVISDERVIITMHDGFNEPSPVSPVDVFGFKTILKTIRQVYPDAIVAPALVIGASDSRKYLGVCKNIYNFAPIVINSENLISIHGIDERIKIEDFNNGIGFFYLLIKNSSELENKISVTKINL
jgi:carboxypeptidase PM20D1